jgi:hypothetical protein
MTGEEVLALAASHGVRVVLALGDLHLEADHEPAAEALAALRDHKEAVVAELSRIAATAGEWSRIFEGHVATVMRVRRLPRPEAERGVAGPRRPAEFCCRSVSVRMHGCTRIAGSHGARSAEPRPKKISPAWAL